MAKANIVHKQSISIKCVLDISKEDNQIYIQLEDNDEPMTLADVLQGFDNSEVTINVAESTDIA